MTCTICLHEGNIKTMYNDCIIESLEKIKFHYMSLKGKLNENELLTNNLKEENNKLKKTLKEYEELEKNESKKRRTASCEDDNDSEISFSQNVAKSIAQKSSDDLNTALNFEEEFELSFIPNTQVEIEIKREITTKREPLKVLPVKSGQLENKPSEIKQKPSITNKQDIQCDKNTSFKKSPWTSKENEIKKLTLGSVQKRHNRSLKHIKQELKSTSMSLKPGKLRQTRLQLDISKNASSTFSDTTFCDEAIEASPNAETSLKRINTSKQWQLRNISSKITKPDDDSILDFSNTSLNKSSTSQSPTNKSLETSSVVMLTPATQDIIFLDETCESFNIESMDLLKDLMNPTESLSNLRRMESDRIKMLQKTNGGHGGYIASKCSDFDEKQTIEKVVKSEQEFAKPKTSDKNQSIRARVDDKTPSKGNNSPENHNKIRVSPVKVEKLESVKRTRIFDVDCNECQTYIKYLGGRLTDEEIEQHIRNCTNHKKRINENLTPDGFWNPLIEPFASDDPRNVTQIDDRFIGKKS